MAKLKKGKILVKGAKIEVKKLSAEDKELVEKTIQEQKEVLKRKEIDRETLRMVVQI